MSGVLTKKLGRMYSAEPEWASSLQYSSSSALALRQVK